MARLRKLSELEEMVRWQSDQEHAELRHTPEAVRRAINQSIQEYRELVSENGDPYFLVSHCGTMTPGRAVDPGGTGRQFNWGSIDTSTFDPEVHRIYGLDVKVDQYVNNLDHLGFASRNQWQNLYGTAEGYPVGFFMYNENTLGILPAPNQPYEYTLWYLPVLPALMNDDDEFNPGLPGGEEWIVWDLLTKLLVRDNYPRQLAYAEGKRQQLSESIISRARQHQRVGPAVRLDTRRQTMLKRTRRQFYRGWA